MALLIGRATQHHPDTMTDLPAITAGATVAPLVATRTIDVDPPAVCDVLGDLDWLGVRVADQPERSDTRRVQTDLAFALGGDGRVVTFRKAALVEVGPVRADLDGCFVDIAWRAASFAPLFPVFAGRLSIRTGGLHLAGSYAPPGGGVGLLVDRTVLHYVAQRTASWLLDRLAAEFERELARPDRP